MTSDDDFGDDVIVIPDDDPQPRGLDAWSDDARPTMSYQKRLLVGLAVYLLVGFLPGAALSVAASAVAGWTVSLSSGQAQAPWVMRIAPWLPALSSITLLGGVLIGVAAVAWSARDLPARIAGVSLLLTLHGSLLIVGGGLTVFSGVVAANQPRVHLVAKHPTTPKLRATLARVHGDVCGWELSVTAGANPQATMVKEERCDCGSPGALPPPPDAAVRWIKQTPVLVDSATGAPYQCRPPPSKCQTGPTPTGLGELLVVMALLFMRRQCSRASAPAA